MSFLKRKGSQAKEKIKEKITNFKSKYNRLAFPDLIRHYINLRATSSEQPFINQYVSQLQIGLKEATPEEKVELIQQLIFLDTVGVDTTWADFDILDVISQDDFSAKRIGYLAAQQCWNTHSDVVLMATSRILKDLTSVKTANTSIALSSLPPYISETLAQQIAQNEISLMKSAKAVIRQKSAIVFYHICLQFPEALSIGFPALRSLLDDPEPSVVLSALSVFNELCMHKPSNFVALIPQLHKMLENSSSNWITLRIIPILRMLSSVEPRLPKKLVAPFTSILETTQSITVLFECVRAIITIPIINSNLLIYAAQRMQGFLQHQDPNLRFLCLQLFIQLMQIQPKLVAQHKDLITECLDSPDDAIRILALDLLGNLANRKTVDSIVQKMYDHFHRSAATIFRGQIVEKIISMCSKNDYSLISDFGWYISVLGDLLEEGNFPATQWQLLADQFLDLALRVPVTRSELIPIMSKVFELTPIPEIKPLLLAASHIISEYADTAAPIEIFLNPGILKAEERIQASAINTALKLYLACQDKERGSAFRILESKLPPMTENSPPEVQDCAKMTLGVLDIVSNSPEALSELQKALVGEMPELGPLEAPAELLEPVSLFANLTDSVSVAPKKKIKKIRKVGKKGKSATNENSINSNNDKDEEEEIQVSRGKAGKRVQNIDSEKVVILKRDDAPLASIAKLQKEKEIKQRDDRLANIDLSITVSETEAKAFAQVNKTYENSSAAFARKKLSETSNSLTEPEKKKTTVKVRGRLAKQSEKKTANNSNNSNNSGSPISGPKEGARKQVLGENGLIVIAKEFVPKEINKLEVTFELKNDTFGEITGIDVVMVSKGIEIDGKDSTVVQGPISSKQSLEWKIVLTFPQEILTMQTVQIRFTPSGSGETITGNLKILPSFFLIAANEMEFETASQKTVNPMILKMLLNHEKASAPKEMLQCLLNIVRGIIVKDPQNKKKITVFAKNCAGIYLICTIEVESLKTQISISSENEKLSKAVYDEISFRIPKEKIATPEEE